MDFSPETIAKLEERNKLLNLAHFFRTSTLLPGTAPFLKKAVQITLADEE